MVVLKVLAVLVTVLAYCQKVAGVRCYECTHAASPAVCHDVTTCTQDDYCYVEEFITSSGNVVFSSGCMNKNRCTSDPNKSNTTVRVGRSADLLVCSECCYGDFCNLRGCGETELPRHARGPYCFDCPYMTSPDLCDRVSVCQSDQQCSVYIPPDYNLYPTQYYSAGCQTNDTCNTLSRIGSNLGCQPTCCNDDHCNIKCGTPPTTPPTTATAQTTTHSTTTQINLTGASNQPSSMPNTTSASQNSNQTQTTPMANSANQTSASNQPQTTHPLVTSAVPSIQTVASNQPITTPTLISANQTGAPNQPQTTLSVSLVNHTANQPQNTPAATTANQNVPSALTQSTPAATSANQNGASNHTQPPLTSSATNNIPTSTTVHDIVTTPQWHAVTTAGTHSCHKDTRYHLVHVPHEHHGMCIMVSNIKLPWGAARTACQIEGGDLMVLDTHEKEHAVKEFMKHYGENHPYKKDELFWIGLYDKYNNDRFEWVDGSQVRHETVDQLHHDHHDPHGHPAPHDPHGPHNNNNCVHIEGHGEIHMGTSDCINTMTFFICERKIN